VQVSTLPRRRTFISNVIPQNNGKRHAEIAAAAAEREHKFDFHVEYEVLYVIPRSIYVCYASSILVYHMLIASKI
jgi:hypothetical protein